MARLKFLGRSWWAALRQKGWRFLLTESQVSFFPVVLVLALAAMSYWLAVVSTPAEEDITGTNRHNPEDEDGNFTVRSFSERGLKKDVLSGNKAIHYPDDESTMILKPNLIHSNAGSVPPTTIKSDVALLNSDQSEVELKGNVVGFRPAYGGREAITFRSAHLMVFADEERAETTHRVQINQGKSWIAGTGFDMDNVTQVYNLHSRVEGASYPGSKVAK